MSIAALVLCSLLPQEKVDLGWKIKEGQKFSVSWTMKLTLEMSSNTERKPKTDITMQYAGTLKVTAVKEGKAECEILLTKASMSGVEAGKSLDVLIENGEIKKAEGVPDAGKQLKAQLEKPARLTLTQEGEYQSSGQHFLNSLLGGHDDFFGPRLPAKSVAVGSTWEGDLRSGASKGDASVKITYKLESVEKGQAKIVVNEDKDVEIQGVKMRYAVKTEGFFDVSAGLMRRFKTTVSAKGKGDESRGEKFESGVIVEFEAAPVKE